MLTQSRLDELQREYFRQVKIPGSAASHQRFGQYVCNAAGITDAEIFYSKSVSEAYAGLQSRHVRNESSPVPERA